MNKPATNIKFKGVKDHLIITLDWNQPFDTLLTELESQLKETDKFFGGGKVVLEIGQKDLSLGELQTLHQLLANYSIELYSIKHSRDADQEDTVREQPFEPAFNAPELPVHKKELKIERPRPIRHVTTSEDKTVGKGVLIKRTLRSGQVINHSSSVILIGDVNPGAEVVAGQDIVIWGSLRGVAYAGSMGDPSACIYALYMAPSQLRIADYITRTPKENLSMSDEEELLPEVARIEEGKIIVEQWDIKKNRLKGD